MMRPADSTPICRCRVLYLGSAVPHITKDGLQGIQEPLKELYPEQGALGARGIDSWLSVWSNGLLLENVDENHKKITRFFPIESLHYCAAVRFVLVPEKSNGSSQPRFLPLDSPFARSPNPNHPPLFAAILRRTSGIKVLECHTFICKREMAANALVRCCFHAYADSSYAKQSEGGGANGTANNSIYGTVRTNRSMGNNTIEKVEGWRRMTNGGGGGGVGGTSAAGSTLTLNSAHSNGITMLEASANSMDDLSECNGDENHKVWVSSSTKDLTEKEDLYGVGNTMRSSRSSRPRQLVGGVAPPPPPPPPPVRDDKSYKKNKERPRRKRTPTGGSREDLYAPSLNGSLMRPMNGGRNSVSLNGTLVSRGPPKGFMQQPPPPPPPNHIYSNGGTLLRPMNGYQPHPHQLHHHHPGMMHPPPPPPPPPIMMVPTTLPHSKKMHKMKPGMMPAPRPGMIPANFMPVPMYIHTGGKKPKHGMPVPIPMAMEEPIYMPSARPLSPIASYQPEHFPHEAYLMQQYANNNYNINNNIPATKGKKGKKDKKSKDSVNGIGMIPPPQMAVNGGGMMMMQPPPVPPPQMANVNGHRVNGNGIMPSAGHEETDDTEDSVYSTGIYRRKGHMNERAFSYSIRQEHRSRSYGSLANLKFAAPPIVPNGVGVGDVNSNNNNKVDMKKEREIMQMMQDLELSGDELDRAEHVVHQKQMHHHQKPVKTKR